MVSKSKEAAQSGAPLIAGADGVKAEAQKAVGAKTTEQKTELSPPQRRQRETLIITHDDIALRAWEIWIAEGCPDGKHLEHWLQAELQLSQEQA